MRRKTLPLITVLTLAGAACGGGGIAIRSGPTEGVFVPQVVDFEDASGRGVSLAIDADGNPHLAYLAFESNEAAGGAAAQEDPGAPKLPAVRHAHLIEGLWTRSVVADDQQGLGGGDATAIAVDGEGVHHVVWTRGDALFYSSNAEGAEFSKPDQVTSEVAGGLSIAAGQDGVPRIAFVEETGAEGPGALIVVASLDNAGWAIQTAAEASGRGPLSTAIGVAGDEVLVAYGSEGKTFLARSGPTWSSEVADQDGGIGVSMDVDADGNPHVGYLGPGGEVKHAHSIAGGPWEVSTVADSGGRETTSIAVDGEGVHHIAWRTARGISYANNADGDFQAEQVPGTTGAELPRVGTGARATVYLAWFEPAGAGVVLAIRSDREPLLAVPQPSPTGGPTGPATGPPPCEPSGTTLTIAAPAGATGSGFDQTCLAAPAGEAFTVDFSNDDSTVHNWALYTDESASEHLGGGTPGEPIAAGESTTYEVDPIAEAGQYFYRCDFHPTTMTGTFVVG